MKGGDRVLQSNLWTRGVSLHLYCLLMKTWKRSEREEVKDHRRKIEAKITGISYGVRSTVNGLSPHSTLHTPFPFRQYPQVSYDSHFSYLENKFFHYQWLFLRKHTSAVCSNQWAQYLTPTVIKFNFFATVLEIHAMLMIVDRSFWKLEIIISMSHAALIKNNYSSAICHLHRRV